VLDPPLTPCILDRDVLDDARRHVRAGGSALQPAADQLRADAGKALAQPPRSVVEKTVPPPSGDPHDYRSEGVYWWPNPDTPDGLPYIRRDGEGNPDSALDRRPMSQVTGAARTLALGWFFFGEARYAEHAATLLRTWFLDEATRMNPHLRYAQGIPGVNEGRGIGIITTAHWPDLFDHVRLIEDSPAWTRADREGLEAWVDAYRDWIETTDNGREALEHGNNIQSATYVQVVQYALFTGRPERARAWLERVPDDIVAAQVEPDGSQPRELARTRSFLYSMANLRHLTRLADLAARFGIDVWRFETPDGRSIRRALDWTLEHAFGGAGWPAQEIGGITAKALIEPLRRAARALDAPRYEDELRRHAGDAFDRDRAHLLFPPRDLA
jgi:hypothetical protein